MNCTLDLMAQSHASALRRDRKVDKAVVPVIRHVLALPLCLPALLPDYPRSVIPHPLLQNEVLCHSLGLGSDRAVGTLLRTLRHFMERFTSGAVDLQALQQVCPLALLVNGGCQGTSYLFSVELDKRMGEVPAPKLRVLPTHVVLGDAK